MLYDAKPKRRKKKHESTLRSMSEHRAINSQMQFIWYLGRPF